MGSVECAFVETWESLAFTQIYLLHLGSLQRITLAIPTDPLLSRKVQGDPIDGLGVNRFVQLSAIFRFVSDRENGGQFGNHHQCSELVD